MAQGEEHGGGVGRARSEAGQGPTWRGATDGRDTPRTTTTMARPMHGTSPWRLHAHGHSRRSPARPTPRRSERGFALGVALNLGFVAAGGGGRALAGSLALLADAGHNLSDVLGLVLAWGAARLARRRPAPRRTYGLHRGTILAALANAMLLLVAVGAIALESSSGCWRPSPWRPASMLWVAAAGVVVNAGTALLFARGREARPQPPRRLPAHAGGCRRLGWAWWWRRC